MRLTVSDVGLWLLVVVASAVMGLLFHEIVHFTLQRLGRRSAFIGLLIRRAHRPFLLVSVLVAIRLGNEIFPVDIPWRRAILHGLLLAIIGAGAWLAAALLMVFEEVTLSRLRTDVRDNRQARRVLTQIKVLRRITIAAVAVLAFGAMLMTFPPARTTATTLLASAAVVGAIAAFSAQSLLGNLFAGIQIAFSDSIRLDDVLLVEGEWGRVEDITLIYVVLHIWDDRRLVLPTSYFIKNPFENWTRYEAAVIGTVEFDLDWSAPFEEMRRRLREILEESELWDGRVCVLQVTDAVGGNVRVRALVSADDAPTLWELRCLVRELLIDWLRKHHPAALPKTRATVLTVDHRGVPVEMSRAGGPQDSDGPEGSGPRDGGPRRSWPLGSGPQGSKPQGSVAGASDDDTASGGDPSPRGETQPEDRRRLFAGPDEELP